MIAIGFFSLLQTSHCPRCTPVTRQKDFCWWLENVVAAVWHKYCGSQGKLLLQRHNSRNISRPVGSVVRLVRLLRGNIAGRSPPTQRKINFLRFTGSVGHTSAPFPDTADIFLTLEHTFALHLRTPDRTNIYFCPTALYSLVGTFWLGTSLLFSS